MKKLSFNELLNEGIEVIKGPLPIKIKAKDKVEFKEIGQKAINSVAAKWNPSHLKDRLKLPEIL